MGWQKNSVEREVTLIIVARWPETVAREIAALGSLADCGLVERQSVTFRDIYWDLPDGRLGANFIALRLRLCEEQTLITLKGPSQLTRAGGQRRSEIEEPWSEAALMEVLELLEADELAPPTLADLSWSDRPVQVMRDLGLVVVQDRETLRIPRDVIPRSTLERTVMAELAIDRTTFSFDGARAHHHEIEIEAKAPSGETVFDEMVMALLQRFPNQLRPWNHSKLATGKAISELLLGDAENKLVSGSENLTPNAYEMISAYLSPK